MNNIIISNKKPIVIGRQGENNVTTIRFSIDALFPNIQNATYGLLHQRHGDAAPYPVTTMAIGGYVNWVINSGDVGNVGNGTAQLTAYKDGAVAKSIIFTTITLTSMGTTDAPDPVQIYIDRIVRAGQEAVNAAADAEESAEEAAASAEAAAGSAEAAAGSAEAAAGSAEEAAQSASDAQQILDDISSTVETELTEAKESGEFDGPRGYSVYGGSNIIIVNWTDGTHTENYCVDKVDAPDAGIGDFILGKRNGEISLMKVAREDANHLFGDSAMSLIGQIGKEGPEGPQGPSGYSPTVTVADITGGHRVTITDANGAHSFDVMDGEVSQAEFNELSGEVGDLKRGLKKDTSYLRPAYTTNVINNDGSLGTGTAQVTNFLPVTPGETLTLNGNYTTKIAFYDDSYTFISVTTTTSNIHDYIVPDRAVYARYQNVYNSGDEKPFVARRKKQPENKSLRDLILSPLKTVIDIGFTGDSNTEGYGLPSGALSWADLFGNGLSEITTLEYGSVNNPWTESIGASGYSTGYNFKINAEFSFWTDATEVTLAIGTNYSSAWEWYVDGVATGELTTNAKSLDGNLHKVTVHFTAGQATNPRFIITKSITFTNVAVSGVSTTNMPFPADKDWVIMMVGTNNRQLNGDDLANSYDTYCDKTTYIIPFPNHKEDSSYTYSQMQVYSRLAEILESIGYDVINLSAIYAYPFFDNTLYQSDLIHFSANGHRIIANMVSGAMGLPLCLKA